MPIQSINIRGVRNLHPFEIHLEPGVNFIYGANGSGKTSLLEAITLMATGKSFRTSQTKHILNLDDDRIEMSFFIEDDNLGAGHLQSLRLKSGDHLLKLNDSVLTAQTEAAHWLPLQIMDPTTFKLLSGSPDERRQFIDWGLFHVEQDFIAAWKVFRQQLKQRNAALKQKESEWIQIWNKGFIESALAIDHFRKTYLKRFKPEFETMLQRLNPELSVDLSYYPGWDKEQDLVDVLEKQQERDFHLGYTQSGPHRAELRIKKDKLPAAEILSRGQQKTVVAALKIAQGAMFQSETGRKTIYLIDDLASELDANHRQALCSLLEGLNCQVLITSIDKDQLQESWNFSSGKFFKLEHGQVLENA